MKKLHLIQFLLIATVAIVLSSCTNSGQQSSKFEQIQHYRQLLFTESPWDEIKGTYKVTAQEAEKVNNYKFTYDESKRLLKVEYCRGDSLLAYSRLGAAKIQFIYEEGKEIRHYFDKNNSPKTVAGEVFKSVFSVNETGFKTGLKFYNKDGEPIENRNKIAYYTWSKTPIGMLKENRFNSAGEEVVLNEFCPFYELRFSYDENGIVQRMANYEKDVLYDCTAENCGNIGVSYFDFKMNEKGGLLAFSVHNTKGQLSNLYWGWARFVHKLDENGNVIERELYDQDDELLSGKKIPIYQYKYDEAGSLVEERFLDKNRQLMENPKDSVAVKQYKYDDFGNRTETVLLNKELVKKTS